MSSQVSRWVRRRKRTLPANKASVAPSARHVWQKNRNMFTDFLLSDHNHRRSTTSLLINNHKFMAVVQTLNKNTFNFFFSALCDTIFIPITKLWELLFIFSLPSIIMDYSSVLIFSSPGRLIDIDIYWLNNIYSSVFSLISVYIGCTNVKQLSEFRFYFNHTRSVLHQNTELIYRKCDLTDLWLNLKQNIRLKNVLKHVISTKIHHS